MHIAKIIKKENKVGLVFCDKDLKVLEEESFEDVSSLNFFLQTLPRKYDVEKTLLIVHDQSSKYGGYANCKWRKLILYYMILRDSC